MDKYLVIENDHSQIPTLLTKYLEGFEYKVIFNFSNEVKNSYEDLINLMCENIENGFSKIVCSPSFIGYDNSFENWLFFLNDLKERSISLELEILYGGMYDTLPNEILNYLKDMNDGKKIHISTILNDLFSYHQISDVIFDEEKQTFIIRELIKHEL